MANQIIIKLVLVKHTALTKLVLVSFQIIQEYHYININISFQQMGNNQNRLQGASALHHTDKMAELTDTLSGEESVWEQSFQYHNCCGIQYQKIMRKKIIWENNFIKNCQEIKHEFEWANDMMELVNNCELSKTKYFREMQSIKAQLLIESPEKTQVLSSAAEVQNFKKNLKKSVLLSFSQAPKFMQQPIPTKITSAINTSNRNSKISFQRFQKNSTRHNANSTIKIDKTISMSSSRTMLKKSILSFVDDTISSVLGNDRQISRQTAKELQVFLTFTMILQKHLSDVNCMLGRIKRLFIVFVEKNYRDPVTTGCHIDELVDNIKQFIMVLKEAVYDYYHLSSFGQGEKNVNLFISNEENIVSAVTALLFRDSVFHGIVFNGVAWFNKNREERFDKILRFLKGSTPQKFMVKEKFCLNHRTIRAYLTADSSQQQIENVQISDVVENMQPYRNCMNQLLQLSKSKSPINKMKAIMACSQGITSQIERFYDLNGLRKEKWMLDADQVLSIFCYILVGARVQHLHTHLFMLDNFATNHQMISMAGYYLSVMNCAVEQIENEFGKDIDKQQL